MQVHQTTFQELVEGERQFRIPLFQRPYTWGRSNHAQLWEDILEQHERLDQTDAPSGTMTAGHFMGSLVLAPIETAMSERVRLALVVDGQQRLTTLLILLCVIRDVRRAHNPQIAARYDGLYLLNTWSDGLLRYRLIPTQTDRPAFFSCLDGSPAPREQNGISAAYRFYLEKLGADATLDLERLTSAVVKGLVFVDITTGPDDNPHRIFESLNATGVDLTQADLLRNHIFMLLPRRGETSYEQVWRPMEEKLGLENLEGLARVDLQRQGIEVGVDDVYRVYQKQLHAIRDDESKVVDRIRDLAVRAGHYKRLIDPGSEPDRDLRRRFDFLRRWGAQTTYPLLMHLLDQLDQGRSTLDEVRDALAYIESFLVRRLLTGVSSRALNRLFVQVRRDLDPSLGLADAVRHALSYERYYWATDAELRAAIRTRSFYFTGRAEQKRLVLQRLEESYEDPEMVDSTNPKITIEHILPQTLSQEWCEHLAKLGQDAEVVRAELAHTLGNLTLTAHNGLLSNNPFQRKQEILQDSNFRLNRAVREQNNWGRDEILARADELAAIACRIWPGPLPGSRGAVGGFDWSLVDAAVAAVPSGSWTAYGDLAELSGTAAIAVGDHVASAPNLVTAYRVLGADGRPRPDFRWSDPSDTRSVVDVLRGEGLRFSESGAADPTQRLSASQLKSLIDVLDEDLETEWDPALIERAVRESGPPMRRFLFVLAERAGEWVPIHELAEALTVGNRYIPGMLGAFTVRCRNRYKRDGWPFKCEFRDRAYCYQMEPETARLVADLRGILAPDGLA